MVQGWSKNQTVFKRLGFEFYSNSVLPISTDDNTESLATIEKWFKETLGQPGILFIISTLEINNGHL